MPAQALLQALLWEVERRWRQLSFRGRVLVLPPGVSAEHGQRLLEEQGYFLQNLPPFFLNPRERKAYQQAFSGHFSAQQVLQEADLICEGRFCILGRRVDCAPGIDWQGDFFSGYGWDKQKRYFPLEWVLPQIQPGQGADVKVPWELSRLQFVISLGQAYWLSDDEKYARAFGRLLGDWLENNPPYYGINWCSPMEAAVRAANLIWGIYFFAGSSSLEEEFILQLVSLLEGHGQFIYANLEKWRKATGNHYLANLAGLIYLGGFLGQPEWLNFARQELALQMEQQVLADGVDFEASTGYHRLALECFFYPAWLCRINGLELPQPFWEKLKQMFVYTRAYLKANQQAPQLGDNDSGRLHSLAPRAVNDHSYLLAIGQLAFPEEGFKLGEVCAFPELLWVFGPEALGDYQQKPAASPVSSEGFPAAGVYIMRSHEAYMLISCGANGFYDKGCHAHNDKLSFELNFQGEDFIIDPGSYLYTPDPEERNRFRGTAYHNTVQVDNQEQNRFKSGEAFFLYPDAHPRLTKWEAGPEQDIFEGRHDGYARLKDAVIHRRQVLFDKRQTAWTITDTLEGEGEHLLQWFLHLAPGVQAEVFSEGEFSAVLKRGEKKLALCSKTKPLLTDTYYSPEYGVKMPTLSLSWALREKLPYSGTFIIRKLED